MNISIFDYGTGNLHSLEKALGGNGHAVRIDPRMADALAADAIVLPGVGNFGAAAERLDPDIASLRGALDDGLPCLGICLGMQLLFEGSEEAEGAGIGVIPGRVRRLKAARVPHMGWNDVEDADDPLFAGVTPMIAYYANSFVCQPADASAAIAWTTSGTERWPAAVRRGRTVGVQFHPEKSGAAGLRLLRNFLAGAVR